MVEIEASVKQYGNIVVKEREGLRWLEFDDGVVQSIIDLEDPAHLPCPVSRALLAALMFIPQPQRVLLLGAGAGSIPHFLSARCRDITGHAVECSEQVVHAARHYFGFPQECYGWQLMVSDARDYLEVADQIFDLVIIDIAEGKLTPLWVSQLDVLARIRERLAPAGALAINLLVDDASGFTNILTNIRQVFAKKTVCLTVPNYKNIIVFALSNPSYTCDDVQIVKAIPSLEGCWGLEFGLFLAQMRTDNPSGSGVF